MSIGWLDPAKLLLSAAGGACLMMLIYTPPTHESLTHYLQQHDYSEISVGKQWTSCGRGGRRYTFEARTAEGRRVAGEVCLNGFPMFYSVKLYRA